MQREHRNVNSVQYSRERPDYLTQTQPALVNPFAPSMVCQPNESINRNRRQSLSCSTREYRGPMPFSENADVVADALLLVLSDALGNPGNVPDFLYWC